MKYAKTFTINKEQAPRISEYYLNNGYKKERSKPGSYKFKRGSGWANLYATDVVKYSTVVDVQLSEIADNRVQVLVNYDINTDGVFTTSGDRGTIEAEVVNLEAFVHVHQREGDTLFCTKCGQELPKDSNYCNKCGAKLTT